ncbi:MFS transporter [Micromonospora sp. NPDC047670]|uniref:MFS transporter n=1 Tax=Micromonospora sp. NPDC047670 TaxID=3364252 RepID=UPI003712ECA5
MTAAPRLGRDFRWYLTGHAVSSWGSAFTLFAVPLLVYRLTGSAQALGTAVAVSFAPYLLFGLVLGAVVDRTDRKALMVRLELARAALLLIVPLLAVAGLLRVGTLYALSFLLTTMRIAFDAGRFAVVATLVGPDDLVAANGRLEAVSAAARVLGPVLAGAVVAVAPIVVCLVLDAVTYLVSAACLLAIRRPFRAPSPGRRPIAGVGPEIREGLRYVIRHPVLRTVSLMMVLANLVDAVTLALLVVLAKQQLGASDTQLAWLYAAGAAGVLALATLAPRLRAAFSFAQVAVGAQLGTGLLTVAFGLNRSYVGGLVLWALVCGLGATINIAATSLRQLIVPDRLRGRVMTVAAVLAWSAVPVGAVAGGVLTERFGPTAVCVAAGLLAVLVGAAFLNSPLRRADSSRQERADAAGSSV